MPTSIWIGRSSGMLASKTFPPYAVKYCKVWRRNSPQPKKSQYAAYGRATLQAAVPEFSRPPAPASSSALLVWSKLLSPEGLSINCKPSVSGSHLAFAALSNSEIPCPARSSPPTQRMAPRHGLMPPPPGEGSTTKHRKSGPAPLLAEFLPPTQPQKQSTLPQFSRSRTKKRSH